ncbi:MAG: hypothetical protein ACRCT8_02260 [Lacipirellulaceae bacterium]
MFEAASATDDVSERVLRFAAEVETMANAGVRAAQEEARRAGVPCVYSINGILHWELPDGSLTTTDPWKGPDRPEGGAVSP